MKLRSLIVVVALTFIAAAAHAQVGLYLNPIAISVSNTADPGTFSYLGPGTTERVFGGVAFGAYYDFLHHDKIGVGIDLRDEALDGNGASLNNFFGGARLSYQPTASHLRPYLEPFVGEGYTEAPDTGIHLKKLDYGILGGLDYALTKHIDFRVLEVGYSTLATASDGTIGGTVAVSKSKLVSFSTGFVFRFGH
jgi:hypothetical protein